MTWVEEARAARRPRSVGLIGNAAEVLPELVERGVQPDVVTDQTSAHDPLYGYIPTGLTLAAAAELRQRDPQTYVQASLDAMTRHVQALLDWHVSRAALAKSVGVLDSSLLGPEAAIDADSGAATNTNTARP